MHALVFRTWYPTCRPCWHKVARLPETDGCEHEEAPPNSAVLEVCWPRSFPEDSRWDLRGTTWFLPPASAGWNWGSAPASAPLSAWTRGYHCRLPSDTCLDRPRLPQADGTLSFDSKSFSIYLVILRRDCGHVSAMQCRSCGTTEDIRICVLESSRHAFGRERNTPTQFP